MTTSPLDTSESLFKIADFLKDISIALDTAITQPVMAIETAARTVEKSWSASWLGYQANVYYEDFKRPPTGAHFSQEWGFKKNYSSDTTIGDWLELDPAYVENEIYRMAGSRDMKPIVRISEKSAKDFEDTKVQIISLIDAENVKAPDQYLKSLKNSVEKLALLSKAELVNSITPNRTIISRDNLAVGQGLRTPPHIKVLTDIAAIRQPQIMCKNLSDLAIKIGLYLSRKTRAQDKTDLMAGNVFIGHGSTTVWKELQSYLNGQLHLPCNDFNRTPLEGTADIPKLYELLDSVAVAFLVITAGDQQVSGKNKSRLNLIHEAGLFQGRLGFSKAIILFEEGCDDFHEVRGIAQIRFPRDNIKAAFGEVHQILEREKLITVHEESV